MTGSTDGIGKLAAIQLAKNGHKVLLHGRNSEKLKLAIQEVKEQSGSLDISGLTADFSNLQDVKSMAKNILDTIASLDVLINNAGVFNTTNPINHEGRDVRMVVNYLAPYLLTKQLLPLLQKSSNPRIVNLSSAAQSPVDANALSTNPELSTQQAYAQSKLALTMWSFDLAKKVSDTTVVAVNPGSLLNTKMAIEAYGQHWSSADKGSSLLVDLATSSEFEGVTGKYFDNDLGDPRGKFGPAHSDAYNQQKIDQLTTQTEQIISEVV